MICALSLALSTVLVGPPPALGQVAPPSISVAQPLTVSAQAGVHWLQDGYDVWLLTDGCELRQGDAVARGREAVLWIEQVAATEMRPYGVHAYLEGQVEIDNPAQHFRLKDERWFGHFEAMRSPQVEIGRRIAVPHDAPPVFVRGRAQFDAENSGVVPAQFAAPAGGSATLDSGAANTAAGSLPPLGGDSGIGTAGPASSDAPTAAPFQIAPSQPPASQPIVPRPAAAPAAPRGALPFFGTPVTGPQAAATSVRRIRAFGRGDVSPQVTWERSANSAQWTGVITQGVNLIIDGLVTSGVDYGTLDIAADRVVIWTAGDQQPDLFGRRTQDARIPLELYLEGNIVFRQGERTIFADRMYYDVLNHVGTILNAEILAPVPNYEGYLRLRTAVLQQTGEAKFVARDTFITSSRMGRPGYRLQAGEIEFEDQQSPAVDPLTNEPILNPETNEPVVEHRRQVTSRDNLLYMGPVPVFYWPVFATNLEQPTFYIRRAQLRNDNVFGFQALTDFDGYQILGIRNPPTGTHFDFSLDWMSERGFGHGATFGYNRPDFFGFGGPTRGMLDYWGIKDDGVDDLGLGRRALVPETDYRYRLLGQHRQQLPWDLQLTAELGLISDRNFVQSYFEREWYEFKDMNTGVELKRTVDNSSLSLAADARVNPFFTQTEWLPRLDHFWLGQPLLGDTLTWYEHTSLAYARFERLSPPTNPNDQPFTYLPWETGNFQGERLITRQEIDWPFLAGPVKFVPYALGELADWGEDLSGDDLQRAYGQVGVRASLPFWRADPTVENTLWNVHGIAHKSELQAEFYVAEASQDVTELPLYDPLDDDSVEGFRRRLATLTFGAPSPIPPIVGNIPPQFDSRFYAVRSGMASWVTAPSMEIADDLLVARLGWHNRWQTKRGLPGDRKIVDWIVFNTNISYFPKPSRDDFGEPLGLWDYDFRWHVGDRTTLVSEGIFDFFTQGQKIVSVGAFLERPPRGSLYLGMQIIEGPVSSDVLSLSYSYWMSPKWISTLGFSVDLANNQNIGQKFTVTRVGESMLISAGFNVDAARDSVGVAFAIEPRFLPKGRLGRVGGAQVPPAGAFGLE